MSHELSVKHLGQCLAPGKCYESAIHENVLCAGSVIHLPGWSQVIGKPRTSSVNGRQWEAVLSHTHIRESELEEKGLCPQQVLAGLWACLEPSQSSNYFHGN